jgi:hypothetical protein
VSESVILKVGVGRFVGVLGACGVPWPGGAPPVRWCVEIGVGVLRFWQWELFWWRTGVTEFSAGWELVLVRVPRCGHTALSVSHYI